MSIISGSLYISEGHDDKRNDDITDIFAEDSLEQIEELQQRGGSGDPDEKKNLKLGESEIDVGTMTDSDPKITQLIKLETFQNLRKQQVCISNTCYCVNMAGSCLDSYCGLTQVFEVNPPRAYHDRVWMPLESVRFGRGSPWDDDSDIIRQTCFQIWSLARL